LLESINLDVAVKKDTSNNILLGKATAYIDSIMQILNSNSIAYSAT
jgi:hypothetical protein